MVNFSFSLYQYLIMFTGLIKLISIYFQYFCFTELNRKKYILGTTKEYNHCKLCNLVQINDKWLVNIIIFCFINDFHSTNRNIIYYILPFIYNSNVNF